jgi:hypothetical protein
MAEVRVQWEKSSSTSAMQDMRDFFILFWNRRRGGEEHAPGVAVLWSFLVVVVE